MVDEIRHEIIDIDDLDLVCTGERHIVRIDRPSSPRARNKRRPEVIELIDSDDGHDVSDASASHTGLPKELHLRRSAEGPALPPLKRHANTAIIAALNRSGRRDLKRKASTSTIEILSDDEIVIPAKRTKLKSPIRKRSPSAGADWVEPPWESSEDEAKHTKPKLDNHVCELPLAEIAPPSEPSEGEGGIVDSEDDCVNFLASLDISEDANWLPLPARNRAEDLTPECVPTRSPNRPPPLDALNPRFRSVVSYDRLYFNRSSENQLGKMFGKACYLRPFYHSRRRDAIPLTGCVRSSKLYYDLSFNKIGIIAKYPHLTSGAISKIVQAPGKIVVGAAALAGGAERPDDEDQPLPPENTTGTLVVYNHGHGKSSVGSNYKHSFHSASVHKVQAHCHTRMTDRGLTTKYFCVNDVAFNPNDSSQFLSTGHDFSAQVWEIPENRNPGKRAAAPRMIRKLCFDDVPQEIIYKHDSSVLAIPCTDGIVSLYNTREVFEDSPDTPISLHDFRVAPNLMDQAAGATVWGKESTKDHLFTSSESSETEDVITGYHRAWDTHKYRIAFQLDAKEPGNAMAIAPDGSILVLITGGPGPRPLRLYDVRRRNQKAYETEDLEPLSSNPDHHSELVDCVRFSPDGRLLAIGRGDNRLHVYDIRALSRGPLCKFEHCDSDVGGGTAYGVIEAGWVEGRDRRRIGIVSGGNDGCVRLWEPSLAPCDKLQGMVVGRTDFDVAHFSMGDGCKGEMPIVIGDSGGGLHLYDLMDGEGCVTGRAWPQ